MRDKSSLAETAEADRKARKTTGDIIEVNQRRGKPIEIQYPCNTSKSLPWAVLTVK